MRTISTATAEKFMPEISVTHKPRTANGPDDFGDDASIMLAVKRKNKSFHDLQEHDFGMYCGNNIVAITNWNREFIACEQFDSAEEMHAEWVLD